MKKITFLLTFAALALQPLYAGAMDNNADNANLNQQPALKIFGVPGQNGLGSSSLHVHSLLGSTRGHFTSVPTPAAHWPSMPDLGQEKCINHLRKSLQDAPQVQGIIHATSQGTATAINYVADEDQGKQIKGMILESSLASGNSAIEHTVKSVPKFAPRVPNLTKIPFFYYWAPYVAKFVFPGYSPSGKQPIKSMKKVPNNIPIIFAHSKLDPQLAYEDTCALYYAACENGNKAAYLISKEPMGHVEILDTGKDSHDRKVVQTILKKHTLMDGKAADQTIDLAPYQPDHKQFRQVHDKIVRREKIHTGIGYAINVGLVAGTLAALKYFVLPAAKTFWSDKPSSTSSIK